MSTQNNDEKQQMSPQPTQDHIDKATYWFAMRPLNESHQIDSLAQLIADSEAQAVVDSMVAKPIKNPAPKIVKINAELAAMQARAEKAEAELAKRDSEYLRGANMVAESASVWQTRAEKAEASLHNVSLDLSTANHMIKLERDRADALQTRLKEIESALRKFNLI